MLTMRWMTVSWPGCIDYSLCDRKKKHQIILGRDADMFFFRSAVQKKKMLMKEQQKRAKKWAEGCNCCCLFGWLKVFTSCKHSTQLMIMYKWSINHEFKPVSRYGRCMLNEPPLSYAVLPSTSSSPSLAWFHFISFFLCIKPYVLLFFFRFFSPKHKHNELASLFFLPFNAKPYKRLLYGQIKCLCTTMCTMDMVHMQNKCITNRSNRLVCIYTSIYKEQQRWRRPSQR